MTAGVAVAMLSRSVAIMLQCDQHPAAARLRYGARFQPVVGTVARLPKSCLNDLAKIWGAGPGVLRGKVCHRGNLLSFGDMPVATTRRREPECRQARELGLAGGWLSARGGVTSPRKAAITRGAMR